MAVSGPLFIKVPVRREATRHLVREIAARLTSFPGRRGCVCLISLLWRTTCSVLCRLVCLRAVAIRLRYFSL